MAATLIIENQYSTSPNTLTATALVISTTAENTITGTQSGSDGHQNCT